MSNYSVISKMFILFWETFSKEVDRILMMLIKITRVPIPKTRVKNKFPMQTKKKLVAILSIASLLLSGGFIDAAQAASMSHASDTLSTSQPNTSATHTINFTTAQALSQDEYFQVVLPAGFGTITAGQISCPGTSVASATAANIARCTAGVAGVTAGAKVVTLTGVTNHVSTAAYTVDLGSYTSGGVVKESANLKIVIIGNVTVNASVPSTLSFYISGVASTAPAVNGVNLTGDSGTTTVNFGTLQVGTSSVLGQQLSVTTNATYGYSVTVQQDNVLTNAAGATIDSFASGTPPANPISWISPTGDLGATSTYGHMAFTTDDTSLSSLNFTGSKWFGFTNTTPVEVMYNGGPADGSTQSIGKATVAYRVQITALQEAGDYTNKLTYVATPSY